jgi:ATP-dependent 26S proteasome regulatory subunit
LAVGRERLAAACCRQKLTLSKLTPPQRCTVVPPPSPPGARVALRSDSYTLHILLPTKVDPLVSLMKVEKVPDSTYDMIGGLDQQIKEIKEVGGG